MHDRRLIYVLVAVSAIGFFVLPSTLSMFAGQHSWYDPKDDGIPCEKCHQLEAQEMSALVGPHTGETGYGRMECTYCHRGFEIGTGKIDPNFTSYLNASFKVHAGMTLPCLYCHSGDKSGMVLLPSSIQHGIPDNCSSCHDPLSHGGIFEETDDCIKCHANVGTGKIYYVTPAKGFGLTQNATDKAYGGNRSAHTKFVLDATNNMTMLEDANEACIGCHTRTGVNISWNRAVYLSFDVSVNTTSDSYDVEWNATSLGTNTTFVTNSTYN